jgi:hypothetical protein
MFSPSFGELIYKDVAKITKEPAFSNQNTEEIPQNRGGDYQTRQFVSKSTVFKY